MRFDTVTFWLFFALAWGVWRFLPFRLAKRATLLLSFGFYAWWSPWYLPLVFASILVDYTAGARIAATTSVRGRRAWLVFSLVTNLGLLGALKYTPFLAENVAVLARLVGARWQPELVEWVIPVGISFYTFQSLSYTMDIYRRRMRPVESLGDFALFVAFYPQLVAGPIVRAHDLLPQLRRRRIPSATAVRKGLYLCVQGLFLKVVVADNLGPAVERVFEARALEQLTPAEAWLGALYFNFQIFADFAGYSGIAIGLALLLGLRFPMNFDAPFLACGPSEFWRRWHITLSRWLRDYLYVPLGGNRRGPGRTYVNLMLTMLLGGLWHGASWTFVAWGLVHAAALCVERILAGGRPAAEPASWIARAARMALFFGFLQTTWVLFRATSFEVAWALLERMLVAPFREPFGFEALRGARHLVLALPVLAMHVARLVEERAGARTGPRLRAVAAALMLFLLTILVREAREFLYFQF